MTILLSDPRVSAVPVRECGDPLVALDLSAGITGPVAPGPVVLVRAALAERLRAADAALPDGLRLRVVEGHRSVRDQRAIIASYGAQVRSAHPGLGDGELHRLTSRFVAPLEVAPHVAGAAVDLTLVDAAGHPLDLGTEIDATPEESAGACYFDATVGPRARAHRDLLAGVLHGAGLVNYPTEWWHWSYGDRYWALITGASHALYGPVGVEAAA